MNEQPKSKTDRDGQINKAQRRTQAAVGLNIKSKPRRLETVKVPRT